MKELIYKTGLEIREKLVTSSPLRKPEEIAKMLEKILEKFKKQNDSLMVDDIRKRRKEHMACLKNTQPNSETSIILKTRISECQQIISTINDQRT